MTTIRFTKNMMDNFIQLLEDEHSIDYNCIPIICEIFEEATGYNCQAVVSDEKSCYKLLSKKQRDIYKSKKRSAKINENSKIFTDQ
jgi:hypothetical protein